jgi:flagellar hook-basal body complex protein FliE
MEIVPPRFSPPAELPSIREPLPSRGTAGFDDALKAVVGKVDDLHREKDGAIEAIAAGRNPDIHSAMIAVQRADIAFRLVMQVRNKAISAYQEIMRMNL